jgi:hypothetical protein
MGHDKFSRVLIALDGSERSMKVKEYGIKIARKSDCSQVIALHVIHSQIKYLYSSNVATLVTSGTIVTIVDTAKQEAQKWITKDNGYSKIHALSIIHSKQQQTNQSILGLM